MTSFDVTGGCHDIIMTSLYTPAPSGGHFNHSHASSLNATKAYAFNSKGQRSCPMTSQDDVMTSYDVTGGRHDVI